MTLFKERRNLQIVINDDEYEVEALLQEKSNRVYELTLELPNRIISIEAKSFFDCLNKIKDAYPNILIRCKGYKKNVYPSRMALQMSSGLLAYEMEMGRPAKRSDIVHIFDSEENNLTSSNEGQRQFFNNWLASL